MKNYSQATTIYGKYSHNRNAGTKRILLHREKTEESHLVPRTNALFHSRNQKKRFGYGAHKCEVLLCMIAILDWGLGRQTQPAESSAVRKVRAGGVWRSVVFSFLLSATTQFAPHDLCNYEPFLEFLYEELPISKSPNLMNSE